MDLNFADNNVVIYRNSRGSHQGDKVVGTVG